MLAKITHNDGVYYSPVFAVSTNYPNNRAVVFDPSFSYLTVVNIFRAANYTMLFMNYDTDDFAINEENFKSYWNDRNIFRTVKHKKYPPEMLAEAKNFLHQSVHQEFTKIQSKSDLEALEINSGAFHDGYVLGMCKKDGMLEILFDTSWGSFIILRCQDIVENTLRIGDVFFHCEMKIKDNSIELCFDPMGSEGSTLLKARHIEFKPLFEKRLPLDKFDCTFFDDSLIVQNKHRQIEINTNNRNVLDLQERKVLGYLENDDIMHRFIIFDGDIVYRFYKYHTKTKKDQKNVEKVLKVQKACEEQGFYFDPYPFIDDDFYTYRHDFGELIHSHNYSNLLGFLYNTKIILPALGVNIAFWAIIQLSNPQMDWMMFWVFGPGISTFLLLIFLITYLINMIREKASNPGHPYGLEIYENGLKYFGYNTSFITDYESIKKVEYEKRIIVYEFDRKIKFHKSKEDKLLYDLIEKQRSKKTT